MKLKSSNKFMPIIFYFLIMINCTNGSDSVTILESQKRTFKEELSHIIDTSKYESIEFGLISNKFFIEKPEIKEQIPNLNKLYDSIKIELKKFQNKYDDKFIDKVNISTFNTCIENYCGDNNYNNIDFYCERFLPDCIIFLGNMISDEALKLELTEWYKKIEERYNMLRPRLYFSIFRYMDPSYLSYVNLNTTFWHTYYYKENNITKKKMAVIYFDTKNNKHYNATGKMQ